MIDKGLLSESFSGAGIGRKLWKWVNLKDPPERTYLFGPHRHFLCPGRDASLSTLIYFPLLARENRVSLQIPLLDTVDRGQLFFFHTLYSKLL